MKRVTYDAVHSAGEKIGNRHQNYDVIASAHSNATLPYQTKEREKTDVKVFIMGRKHFVIVFNQENGFYYIERFFL